MPSLPPLEYVDWDPESAVRAIHMLRAVAMKLDHAAAERARAAHQATQKWLGPHREDFDRGLHDTVHRAHGLASVYREAARLIAVDNHRAIVLNRQRALELAQQQQLPKANP
jgi:hypothetical protein